MTARVIGGKDRGKGDSVRVLVATNDGIWRAEPGYEPERLGPAGVSCRSVASVEGVYYAGGTEGGLWRSADEGQSWEPAGFPGKEVWTIVPGADDGSVYAAGRPTELYRSVKGEADWQPLNLRSAPGSETWMLPGQAAGPRIMTVTFDQVDPRVIYAAVEVGGVTVSEDGGRTWRTEVPGDAPDIHWLAPHPTEPDLIFCTTGFTRIGGPEGYTLIPRGGVYRSVDRGRTWTWEWQPELPQYTRAICFDPRPPYPLFVVGTPRNRMTIQTEGGAQARLLMSLNRGQTWSDLGDAAHAPSPALFVGLVPDPERAGNVLVSNEMGVVWRVDPDARC